MEATMEKLNLAWEAYMKQVLQMVAVMIALGLMAWPGFGVCGKWAANRERLECTVLHLDRLFILPSYVGQVEVP
jgi:hypothetical protein